MGDPASSQARRLTVFSRFFAAAGEITQSQVGDEVGGGRVLGKDRADGIGRGATGEATTCWVFELFPHRPAALLPMLTLIHLGGPSTPG